MIHFVPIAGQSVTDASEWGPAPWNGIENLLSFAARAPEMQFLSRF